MANNRIAALDYAKGFAIIMLLLTHCIPDGYVETWAFAWHMPIFFVICGMLHNMRHPVGLPYKQMWKWLKRRSEQIFIPYFLFGVLYAVFLSGLSVIGGGTSGFTDYCFALVTMQGVTSMWFLPVFFFAELFYTFFLMKLPRCVQAFGLVIAIAGLMYMKQAGVPEMWWVRILLKILVGLVFVVAGGFFVRERRLPPTGKWTATVALALGTALALYNGSVGISALKLECVPLFVITGIMLSYAIISVFDMAKSWSGSKIMSILAFFGANTIVVLVTNNLLIEIFRLIEYKLLGNWFLENGFLGGLLMTMILLIPEFCLIKFAQSKYGIVFGRIK